MEGTDNPNIYKNSVILQSNKKSQIPKHAVLISPVAAVNHRLEQIYAWRPKSDFWAIRYGPWFLAAISIIPSVYITQFYRRQLKLRLYGYYTMYMGLISGPAIMSGGFHFQMITSQLVAMNQHLCPICIEAKAGFLQCIFSVFYPMCLAGASGLMFATRHGTAPLPYHKDYKGMLKHYTNISRPLFKSLFLFAAVEIVFANFITYMEANQVFKFYERHLNAEIKKMEQKRIMNSG